MRLQRSYDINHVSSNAAADHPGPRLLHGDVLSPFSREGQVNSP
jgi:hypothetical protein